MRQDAKLLSGINVILGAWLIVASFVLGYASTVALWNSIIVGVIVLILAWIRATNPASASGLSWINAILGLWLIVSPFVLSFSATASTRWNDIVIGVAIIVFSVWRAFTNSVQTV